MSNSEMIMFPRELSDELAELIAGRARCCGGIALDIWEEICAKFGTEAEQAGVEGSAGLYYSKHAAVANGEQKIEPLYRVKK